MGSDRASVVAQIETLAEDFNGVIGVAAKQLQTGDEIRLNADDVFPTASTMKTVVLYALYRQVDDGRIDPSTRIVVEDRHRVPGSGVLQDLDAGAALTIKDIATLMITVSDNAATDLIYDLLGRDAIAATVRRLGMTNTHLPLNTWEMLAGLHNLDPTDPALTYDALKERLRTQEAPWDGVAIRETPETDISTPQDMIRLHEAIERGEGLSPQSRAAIIDILKRQKYNTIIPELLPFGVQTAHKTGSLRGVRNDVGLVYAGETTYAVALMSKRAPSPVAAVRLLADISRVVYDHFVTRAEVAERY